jgi:hypothetical protein
MLKKIILCAAVSATAIAAFPAAADAQRFGHHGRFVGHRPFVRGFYPRFRGYDPYYYDYYSPAYYEPAYYGPAYYGRRYGYRCGPSPEGAIVGGAIGALVGREIGRGGTRYHRGGGATGALLGGAAGALIGSEAGARC